MVKDLLRRLDERGGTGLDLSPGDPLCAEAARAIRELLAMCGESEHASEAEEAADRRYRESRGCLSSESALAGECHKGTPRCLTHYWRVAPEPPPLAPEPAWLVGSKLDRKVLWQEDECLRSDPTAPHLRSMWRELFGKDLDRKESVETWDGGDADYFLFPGDVVVVNSIHGDEILGPRTSLTGPEAKTNEMLARKGEG